MIKVVLYTGAFDTGGQGWRIKQAFDRYQPGFEVHSIHADETYFHYPHDVRYEAGADKSYALTEAADVLHFRNGLEGLKRLRASGRPVGLLLHHHGTRFRDEHATIAASARERRALQVASTIDLTLLEPDVGWLPAPFDLDELATHRVLTNGGQVRVAHAPTNRLVKSTAAVLAAITRVNETYGQSSVQVTLDLMERKTYADVLERKGKADILVDQLRLGYGNNAIEAWGMGIPVIAGVADPNVRAAMIETWGELPFYEANEINLARRIAELTYDHDLRFHWGQVGRRHVQRFHNEKEVSDLLAKYYRAAAERAS